AAAVRSPRRRSARELAAGEKGRGRQALALWQGAARGAAQVDGLRSEDMDAAFRIEDENGLAPGADGVAVGHESVYGESDHRLQEAVVEAGILAPAPTPWQ